MVVGLSPTIGTALNHGGVSRRISGHGLLDEAVEQLASVFRLPAVETESELVQIIAKMHGTDRALVVSLLKRWLLGTHQVHTRQQLAGISPTSPEHGYLVIVAPLFQSLIALPPIRAPIRKV